MAPRTVIGFCAIVVSFVALEGCASKRACRYGDLASCEKSCASEDPASCTRLGAMHELGSAAKPSGEPLRYYLRACLLGDAVGCHMAGLKLVLGATGPTDLQNAQRSFEAACTLDYGNGCAMSGALLASVDPPRAIEAKMRYRKACSLGSPLGCQLMKEVTSPAGSSPPPRGD